MLVVCDLNSLQEENIPGAPSRGERIIGGSEVTAGLEGAGPDVAGLMSACGKSQTVERHIKTLQK